MSNTRKSIPKKVREMVYQKYGGHCAYCGAEIEIKNMQIDHFNPVLKGGEDTVENYMPACRQCNYYKDTFSLEDFRNNLELIPHRLHEQMFIFRLAEKYGRFSIERKPITFYFEKFGKGGEAK